MGRGTPDLAGCLHQIIYLRFGFDCKITKLGCDTVSKDRLNGCTVDVHDVTADTKQAKSPEKVEALMDSGTHTCHMRVPAEVAVYVHTKVLDKGDLCDVVAIYGHRIPDTYRYWV